MTYQFGGDGAEQAGVGMANRMKSEAPGSHEEPGQDVMIELNEMADTAADEDVIELTDVFSIPEEEQNGIIELTELATEEGLLDPSNAPAPIEAGRAAGAAPLQDAGHELLELADPATGPGVSPENQSIEAQPEAALLSPAQTGSADFGGFSAPVENETSPEDELLDFGDLDLGSAELDAVSASGVEADDASEEALFLEDEELVDFTDQAQEAAGGSAAEEGAAAAETAGETQGLLDLEGLATPPEKTLKDDEFSDIFSDLGDGASAASKSAGQPSAEDESRVVGDIGREMEVPAPQAAGSLPAADGKAAVKNLEQAEPLETGNGEEKFILSAGGIRMREKANGSAQQATAIPAQAGVAAVRTAAAVDGTVVSAEQVEAAVERVVRRMFSGKLETMLMEVLEKAVAKEIQRIKNALFAGSSENDSR